MTSFKLKHCHFRMLFLVQKKSRGPQLKKGEGLSRAQSKLPHRFFSIKFPIHKSCQLEVWCFRMGIGRFVICIFTRKHVFIAPLTSVNEFLNAKLLFCDRIPTKFHWRKDFALFVN